MYNQDQSGLGGDSSWGAAVATWVASTGSRAAGREAQTRLVEFFFPVFGFRLVPQSALPFAAEQG
jgi:hypothetical protein